MFEKVKFAFQAEVSGGWGGEEMGRLPSLTCSEQGCPTYFFLSLLSSSFCLFPTAFERAFVENSISAADFASRTMCKLSFH